MNLNKVFLIGRAGQDPDVKKTDHGIIGKVSIATNSSWKNTITGAWEKSTTWLNCVTFSENIANFMVDKIRKGDEVHVEGSIQIKKVKERYYTNISIQHIQVNSKVKNENTNDVFDGDSHASHLTEEHPNEDIPF